MNVWETLDKYDKNVIKIQTFFLLLFSPQVHGQQQAPPPVLRRPPFRNLISCQRERCCDVLEARMSGPELTEGAHERVSSSVIN